MLRVLLVDDEPFILQGLKKLVDWNAEGYEVVATKANGKEALAYRGEHQVELIIADIKMPIMTGLELLATIRNENISDAHFMILSGYSDFSYAQQAIQYNCIDYVLKPVEKDKLLEMLRKVAHMSEHAKQDREEQDKMQQAYLARQVISLLVGKYDEMNLDYVKSHMRISEGVRYVDIVTGVINSGEEEEVVMRANQRKLYEACENAVRDERAHIIFDVSHDEKNYDIGFIFCSYMLEERNETVEEYL